MSDPITAAMIGAGLSGGTSLLRGKSLGKSLKSAAIGGALGGAGGYLGGAMSGAGAATGAAAPGTIGTELVFNPATGTYLNPAYFAGATSSMPLYTGAGSALSQLGTGLGSLGSEINTGLGNLGGSALESMKANPLQTAGLGMNIYSGLNAQPQEAPPPQLGIIRPQQSGQYNPVLNAMLQKRNPYSLLG
jgi:hypothetical protein